MQLFVLDYDPERAVEYLCDIHLRKMCLECAQILSSVLWLQKKIPDRELPKPYNLHHPVIKAIDEPYKINYTVLYNFALHREYFFRFGKNHIYAGLCGIYYHRLFTSDLASEEKFLTFSRVFTGINITEEDLIKASRSYYRFKKTRIKNWHYTRRSEPAWLRES